MNIIQTGRHGHAVIMKEYADILYLRNDGNGLDFTESR